MLFGWIIYFSIGLYILMPGLVEGWRMYDEDIIIKVLGSIIAVAIWPCVFLVRR